MIVRHIRGIDFSIANSSDYARISVANINNPGKDHTKPGTVYDEFMGFEGGRDRFNGNKPCKTCKLPLKDCTGHFGSIDLCMPFMNPTLVKLATLILNQVCHSCSKVFFDSVEILLLHGIRVPKALLEASPDQEVVKFNGTDGETLFTDVLTKVKDTVTACECGTPRHACTYVVSEHAIKARKIVNKKKDLKSVKLSEEFIYQVFSKIEKKSLKYIGFNPEAFEPTSCFYTKLPVIPPAARTPVEVKMGELSEDDLSVVIPIIIRLNKQLSELPPEKELERQRMINSMQQHIRTLIYNKDGGNDNSHSNYVSIIERLIGAKTKESKFRSLALAKRVDKSARTVITCDPNLDTNEFGVPGKIARNLTISKRVQSYNIKQLQSLLNKGEVKTVERGDRTIRVEYVTQTRASVLSPTDTVIRKIWVSKAQIQNWERNGVSKSEGEQRIKFRQKSTYKLYPPFATHSAIGPNRAYKLVQKTGNRHMKYLITLNPPPMDEGGYELELQLTPMECQCTLYDTDEIRHRDGSISKVQVPNKKPFQLEIGDVVHRCLQDGDLVAINRQPTLSEGGFMGCRAKIFPETIETRLDTYTEVEGVQTKTGTMLQINRLKADSFRMSPSTTTTFNADFDGDEMNMHVPTTEEAQQELLSIMNVDSNMISTQTHSAQLGPIQDSVLAAYLMTQEDEEVDRETMMDMSMLIKSKVQSDITTDFTGQERFFQLQSICEKLDVPFNSTRTLLALAFPANLDYTKGDLKIRYGRVISGSITKKHLWGIVHHISKYISQKDGCVFTSNVQRISCAWMGGRGYSIGIKDCIYDRPDEVKSEIYKLLLEARNEELTIEDPELRENRVAFSMNQVTSVGTKVVERVSKMGNNFYPMFESGAKGKAVNIQQIMACLGQQNIVGKRVELKMNGNKRFLPHFDPDMSLENDSTNVRDYYAQRGLVCSSFLEGLTPVEFVTHAMSGRTTICDTVMKTSDTGYKERQLTAAMVDHRAHVDGTIRNNANNVISYAYNGDNIAATEVVRVPGVPEEDSLQFANLEHIADLVNVEYELGALK